VFFGRLEARTGIEVFVDAAKRLDPRIPLRFLGKDDAFEGAPASQWIANQLRGRDVSLITNLNWEQALAYLSQGNRLAVIPSLSDNLPYVVIECAVNGIAFVASKVGGIPEILPDAELQAKLLFEPNPRGLFDCLDRFLHTDEAERRALREKVQLVTDVSANHRRIAECYSQLLQPRPTSSSGLAPVMRDDPLVTVCVPFYNLGAYLPDTLASLAAQTYTKLEVVVINDGSTDAASLRIFDDQQRLYPQFRFVSQPNAGLGATRNSGIAEAKGEYFLPMDSDNIAAPHMVERFVGAMRCRPDVSALTSYFLAFRDTADLAQQKFHYAYRPAGGSYVMGSLENVYGDANAIYRLADLKAIGGYETELDTTCEDWELFVKLLNAGYRVDVLPDYLFYYRHRDDSLVRTTKHYRNRQRVLRQYFRLERLPDPDRMALWTALASLHARLTEAQCRQSGARYRIADELPDFLDGAPRLSRFFSELLRFGRQGCKRMASLWPGRG
jgi:glycosyltransferase involved in cell wall biosynthesis